jgi:hypothetical protein
LLNLKIDGNFKCFLYSNIFVRMISLIFKNQSIYFDEPNQAQPKDSSPEKLPDWVRGELQTGEQRLSDSWQCSSGEDNTLVLAASDAHRYAKTLCFTVLKTYSSFAIGSYIEAFSFFLIIRIWFTLYFH